MEGPGVGKGFWDVFKHFDRVLLGVIKGKDIALLQGRLKS